YSLDYNPVAVLIEKATLDWPFRFNEFQEEKHEILHDSKQKRSYLIYLLEKWALEILKEAKEEIGSFYPEDSDGYIPIGYFWVRTIPCQNPQ
ncbi:MAG: DNA methylase, partial [Candidatus Aenigmarchaeota archaeon]|nr:DNA methylase [Candidatus Aenigmarchaeota archaeon]